MCLIVTSRENRAIPNHMRTRIVQNGSWLLWKNIVLKRFCIKQTTEDVLFENSFLNDVAFRLETFAFSKANLLGNSPKDFARKNSIFLIALLESALNRLFNSPDDIIKQSVLQALCLMFGYTRMDWQFLN